MKIKTKTLIEFTEGENGHTSWQDINLVATMYSDYVKGAPKDLRPISFEDYCNGKR